MNEPTTRSRPTARTLDRAGVLERFLEVRRRTMALCEPLSPEDCTAQAATEASPTHWQLAHTTWFFETFVLARAGIAPFDPQFGYLFNSYYNAVGERVERSKRGLLTRPGRDEILAYRGHVDARVQDLFENADDKTLETLAPAAVLGTHHEDQHQELILTDLKLLFSHNPLRPAYRATNEREPRAASVRSSNLRSTDRSMRIDEPRDPARAAGNTAPVAAPIDSGSSARKFAHRNPSSSERTAETNAARDASAAPHATNTARDASAPLHAEPLRFLPYSEGIVSIGHDGPAFAFDNEGPRHRVFLESFTIASRPVTNGEFLAFMEDGGYARPDHWLSDGWDAVRAQGWRAPMYWESRDGEWWSFTLSGMRPVDLAEPVVHVSYFEADAYARWAGARLPREEEWEHAARGLAIDGNFLETGAFHPRATRSTESDAPAAMFGDVWEWTQSAYAAYPRFRAVEGALGEYNGKFMCNQFVLRGGSCASPRGHLRATYRNFFQPAARWQFSGFRLARDG